MSWAFVWAFFSCSSPSSADFILVGGRIHTLTEVGVVEAMAIRDGRILEVGNSPQIRRLASTRTRVLELDGRPVYPGFGDAHAHLLGVGMATEVWTDLVGTASLSEVISRTVLRAQQLPPGAWVLGRGWDQNDWEDNRFPHHSSLSTALPDRPALLLRVDGHALLANEAAMRAAGVDERTPDPPGGRILRNSDGGLTGVFLDGAMALVSQAQPPPNAATLRRALVAGIQAFHSQGFTSVHVAGIDSTAWKILQETARDDVLSLRVHGMIEGSDVDFLRQQLQRGPILDFENRGVLALSSIKLYADGALGSRGAALLEDYSDDAGNRGLILTSEEDIRRITEQALRSGFQVGTHAIGDRGIRFSLNAFAAARAAVPQAKDPRLRIEHAQVVHLDDIHRFQELGVLPLMQTQHMVSDYPWFLDRVGKQRAKGAYAWRRFRDAGCILPGGSDAPVERVDFAGQYLAAVARRGHTQPEQEGWGMDQALTRQEALSMLTEWPAFAAFREHDLGRIAPGMHADLVVLNRDLTTIPLEQISGSIVLFTIFAGNIVFQAEF